MATSNFNAICHTDTVDEIVSSVLAISCLITNIHRWTNDKR